jgi:cytochrome c553
VSLQQPVHRFSVRNLSLRGWAAILLLVTLAALLFAWSGLYNVAATSGHWPAVSWLLRYTMESSVGTHSALIDAPSLDDAALVERGAGHFETGCAPCHGAPGWARNRISSNMLPAPPRLDGVQDWQPEELFRIVKHGLKYTGMPGWPAQSRDDEVWAVVAFLLRLPAMSPEDYAALALGGVSQAPDRPVEAAQTPGALFNLAEGALIAGCARCHGVDGRGRPSGAFPRLDIQTPDYLYRALRDYAEGARQSGMMEPLAAALDEAETRRLAAYFAEAGVEANAYRPQDEAPAPLVQRGLALAAIGAPDRQIPPCGSCHGLEEGPENPLFPKLAGQYAAHIRLQLQLWRSGARGGGAYSGVMQAIAARLTRGDIEAAANYYAALPHSPAGTNGAAQAPQ